MKPLPRLLVAVCTAAVITTFLLACSESGGSSDAEIVVYGSPSCSLCTALKVDLDSRNMDYTFVDISESRDALVDLSRTIADEPWFNGSIEIPIVSVADTFLRRPTVDEIRAAQTD